VAETRSRGALALAGLATAAVLGAARPAWSSDVPSTAQALILTRALAYDRNLQRRAGTEVRIAVLLRAGDPASEKDAERVFTAFAALRVHKLQGLRLQVVKLDATDLGALQRTLVRDDVDAMYVASGLEASVAMLSKLAREVGITTMASESQYVYDGLALGVFVRDNRPTVLLNRTAAEAEGAAFAAGLLGVARLVD
jgi:hypothetical protein